jgi:[ribosomal protein S5]-alanine N-acetyltransferase
VPSLVSPARPAGSLRSLRQPSIAVDGGLVLRPWREGDAAAVQTAFGCPDIQRWHVKRMDSRDEALAWIASWEAHWDGEKDSSWAITDEDQPVGQVGLRAVSLFEGSAELSYWVMPAARGRGVAVQAARELTQWAFDVVGLHRVALQHSTANLASCRVAARLGFPVEGTLRGALLHADGWHDAHMHARLRIAEPCG